VSGYVSKPIDQPNLFDVIEQVTGMTLRRPVAAEPAPGSVAM